jgi:hypothetical protein
MMRTWTVRVLAVSAVAFAAQAAWAAPEPQTTDDKLNQILAQLQDLGTRVRATQVGQEIQQSQIKAMQDEIDRLRADLSRLTDEMHRASVQTNIAGSINPNAPAVPGGPPAGGTIALENRYSFPATVVINGQSYRLMPGERAEISAPAGRFTYAVLTDNYGVVRAATERYLAPGRDFPITIHP